MKETYKKEGEIIEKPEPLVIQRQDEEPLKIYSFKIGSDYYSFFSEDIYNAFNVGELVTVNYIINEKNGKSYKNIETIFPYNPGGVKPKEEKVESEEQNIEPEQMVEISVKDFKEIFAELYRAKEVLNDAFRLMDYYNDKNKLKRLV